MWHVYVLECTNGALYTGIALDVVLRMQEHLSGKGSRYLRSNPPVKVIYQEPHSSQSAALKREAEIKRWPRRKKLAFIQKGS